MIFVNRNCSCHLEMVKRKQKSFECLLTWWLHEKNFLWQNNYAPSVTVSKSFRICWLLLVIAKKKGQEELPDIKVLSVAVILLSQDLMLNTDPGLCCPCSRRCCYSACTNPSPPWKASGARPGEEAYFCFQAHVQSQGCILEVQTRTIPLTDSWRAEPKLGADYTAQSWLRSCLQAGWPS